MRLISWNIRGGGRSGVVDAVSALEPDIAVLVDCKARHVEGIVEKGAAAGYTHHLASCTDYTGILMLSAHPLTYGEIDQAPIRHRWLHAVSDHWGLEIAAIYGPLPKTIRVEPTMREFWNWLVQACDLMVDRKAVLCGDFNTGISGVDGPADYSFSCASQFRELGVHGWRDAYRELHPGGDLHSWWYKGRGFRIDHCMLSRGLRAPNSIVYTEEIAGVRRGPSPSDAAKVAAISDHAALVLDCELS
jgi:exonuclease III